jgi:hypothetical protein
MHLAFHLRRRFGRAALRVLGVFVLLIGAGCPPSGPSANAPWRSALYPANWTPAFTNGSGQFLHDFSYAGYRNGALAPGSAAPTRVFDVAHGYGADASGATDATAAIQSAIDAAQTAGGGVVLFPAGLYRCDGVLHVSASNIVLRGAGAQTSRVYFTQSAGLSYKSHIAFQGALQYGPDVPLAADGVNRSLSVQVADASSLAVGQEVAVGWVITDAFVAEHGMTGTWTVANGQWRPFFRRTIVSLNTSVIPAVVTLDAPLRYPAKLRDAASLRSESGYLSECGVEDLGLSNAVTWNDAWAEKQVHLFSFQSAKDCWVRGVESFASPNSGANGYHLQNSGFGVLASKRLTIANCVLQKAQNRGDGGCGYLFEISQSNEVLVRDCAGLDGRHNFIQNWDFGTTGCVFLRCHSAGGLNVFSRDVPIGATAYSEFHHSLAMACLIDSCTLDDGWYAGNRKQESTGAGHSVTESVLWNNSGKGKILSFQYGQGYVIGTRTLGVSVSLLDPRAAGTAPADHVEGQDLGATLEPQSLYDDQLARRIGG